MPGLIIHPLVSVLKSHDERSELTTQLLFGEKVKITEDLESWVFIENQTDKYQGWVDRKVVKPNIHPHFSSDFHKIIVPVSACKILKSCETIFFAGG